MVFFLEITNMWQKSRIFFTRFLKSIGWNGFSYGFLVVLYLSISSLFHLICSNIHFIKCCFFKTYLRKHMYLWQYVVHALCIVRTDLPCSPPGWQSRQAHRVGQRRDSENFSAFSAGAYTTTQLVRVTQSSPVAVSKQDFQAWKQKTLFLVMEYSALFYNVCKALNLF